MINAHKIKQDICEMEWDKPDPKRNEIEVKNIMTGVCRSDIDMYTGDFTLPSRLMQGHEGLGVVTKVGKDLRRIKEGDVVATRGEPSFADYYNAEEDTFVDEDKRQKPMTKKKMAEIKDNFETYKKTDRWNQNKTLIWQSP